MYQISIYDAKESFRLIPNRERYFLTLWQNNSDWLENGLKAVIESTPIIDEAVIDSIDVIIAKEEVELFKSEYQYSEETSESK